MQKQILHKERRRLIININLKVATDKNQIKPKKISDWLFVLEAVRQKCMAHIDFESQINISQINS
jgi:hypothetical protein